MSETYFRKRGQLEAYFDRTASETWARLTSDAPVSRIRQTVREGRDRMRAHLLSRLPADLAGARVLDAGCGAGQLAVELARRGAEVVAVDISASLLGVAQSRVPEALLHRIDFRAGDMLDPRLGAFDHAVAMDSLIHYAPADIVTAVSGLAKRVRGTVAFTVAPRTLMLGLMHTAGKLFPRSDRSPAIHPADVARLAARLRAALPGCTVAASERVSRGFYISQAMEARRA